MTEKRVDRILEIIHRVVTIGMVAWAGWLSTSVIELGKWQAGINASRFTAENGAQVWREISQIRQDMLVTGSTPPEWFVQRMDRVERRLDSIDERLRAVETRRD